MFSAIHARMNGHRINGRGKTLSLAETMFMNELDEVMNETMGREEYQQLWDAIKTHGIVKAMRNAGFEIDVY